MIECYLLDDNKVPYLVTTPVWADNFDKQRRVALTDIGGEAVVSTVFLGLDHRFWDDGPPILFETMVNINGGWTDQQRYVTYAQALIGHKNMVEKVRAELAVFGL